MTNEVRRLNRGEQRTSDPLLFLLFYQAEIRHLFALGANIVLPKARHPHPSRARERLRYSQIVQWVPASLMGAGQSLPRT